MLEGPSVVEQVAPATVSRPRRAVRRPSVVEQVAPATVSRPRRAVRRLRRPRWSSRSRQRPCRDRTGVRRPSVVEQVAPATVSRPGRAYGDRWYGDPGGRAGRASDRVETERQYGDRGGSTATLGGRAGRASDRVETSTCPAQARAGRRTSAGSGLHVLHATSSGSASRGRTRRRCAHALRARQGALEGALACTSRRVPSDAGGALPPGRACSRRRRSRLSRPACKRRPRLHGRESGGPLPAWTYRLWMEVSTRSLARPARPPKGSPYCPSRSRHGR